MIVGENSTIAASALRVLAGTLSELGGGIEQTHGLNSPQNFSESWNSTRLFNDLRLGPYGPWTDLGYSLTGTVIALIGLVAFFGNGSVLIMFAYNRDSQSATDVFLIAISISDLLISILGNPFSASSSFAHRWLYREAGCQW